MQSNLTISAGTIARTIILLLALINQILSATGHAILPIQDADIETLVTTGFTIVMSIVTWWKNNSFTQAALVGDAAKESFKENRE